MAMFSELTNEQFLAIYGAFDKACAELGISFTESDTIRREQLAAVIIKLAKNGEQDVDAIRTRPSTRCGHRRLDRSSIADEAEHRHRQHRSQSEGVRKCNHNLLPARWPSRH